jgi:hypothetical protein
MSRDAVGEPVHYSRRLSFAERPHRSCHDYSHHRVHLLPPLPLPHDRERHPRAGPLLLSPLARLSFRVALKSARPDGISKSDINTYPMRIMIDAG